MWAILDDNVEYEVIIYPPVFAKLEQLSIEVSDNHYVKEVGFDRNILVIGGKTSMGIGCTTTSTNFSNILGRKLDASIIKVVSEKSSYIKEDYESYLNMNISDVDLAVIELNDIEDNDSEYLKNLISQLNIKCDKIIGWYTKDSIAQKVNATLNEKTDNNQITLSDACYINDMENKQMCYINDDIINDAGNILIFKKLIATVKGIL